MDQKYLVKQHNTWSVVVEIPKALRQRAGQTRFKKSLGTDSLAKANQMKHVHVAAFQRQIALLARGQDPEAELMAAAMAFRQALQAKDRRHMEHRDQESSNEDELLSLIDEEAKQVLERLGKGSADRFRNAATGKATFIVETYLTWHEQLDATGQTKVQHKAAVDRFIAWAGASGTIEETDRKQAGRYIDDLIATSGLTRRTIERHGSALSSLWRWFIARGYAEENPWLGHKINPQKRKGRKRYRRGLEESELLQLLNTDYQTDRYAQTLHDVLRLGLLSGARIEALCALKCANIELRADGYYASIEQDKTDAGTRSIPLHSASEEIIARRLALGDAFLFPGLIPGGPDHKRSWNVTKAYNRFRTLAGVDGKGRDFHALRNTFIERMEGLGIPESTTQLIVGHEEGDNERPSITYGLYSQGRLVDLRAAVETLDYGRAVMAAIARPIGRRLTRQNS